MNKDQKDFHKSRRNEFSKLIGKDSIAIIFGSTHQNRSYDEDFQFKQFKNFYYLTGFTEPDSVLMLAPGGVKLQIDKKEKLVNETLYVQPKDPLMETWNGKRLGYDQVKVKLGIENALDNEQIRSLMNPRSLQNFRKLYINFGEILKLQGDMKRIVSFFMSSLNRIAPHVEIIDASFLLGKMRAVKTPFEINIIKKACGISIKSYNETLKIIKPGLYEFQVQANLEYNYKFNDGENAYGPIVAGGENACILHYHENNQVLKNGELLLIDSGAEYKYYCSDITRTFPVNGLFTEAQTLIYEIVLKANKECIKKIRQGIRFSSIRDLSEKIMAEGLGKAGLLKNIKEIKKYSLHGVGHHLGLDTHDAVASGKMLYEDNDILVAGNVLTIEPGLYFPEGSTGIPKKYWGIGVRIEDDVHVTKNGCENLTIEMVKEVREIESQMKGSSTD